MNIASIRKNKLFRWIFIGLFLVIVEYDIVIGGAMLQHYLGWSPSSSSLLYYISSSILLLLAGFSLLLIPILSDTLKAQNLSIKKLGISLAGICIIFVIVFTGNAMSVSTLISNQISSQEMGIGIQKEAPNYELFNAINKKREAKGVNTLIENRWACVVANIELNKNLELGDGKITSQNSFAYTIELVKREIFKTRDEPFPHFLMEFVSYGDDIPEVMQTWSNQNSIILTETSYKYGCALFLDGYGVVVVADSDGNIYAPDSENVSMLTGF